MLGDYGLGGMRNQIEVMKKHGIANAGTGNTLAEARSPTYIDTAAGRVALIAACSTFHESARAGHQRRDALGRGGLNPLRFETTYRVNREDLDVLKRIKDRLNLDRMTEHRIWGFHHIWDFPEGDEAIQFLRMKFAEGEETLIESRCNQVDLEEHMSMISEARRQADWVVCKPALS